MNMEGVLPTGIQKFKSLQNATYYPLFQCQMPSKTGHPITKVLLQNPKYFTLLSTDTLQSAVSISLTMLASKKTPESLEL